MHITIQKRNKILLISFAIFFGVCLGIVGATSAVKQNDILIIASIYPPSMLDGSHYFVVKKDGTMSVTLGTRIENSNGNSIIKSKEFIKTPEAIATIQLLPKDLATLVALSEKLDSLGVQASMVPQYGGFVATVYYRRKAHEINCIDPYVALYEPVSPEVQITDEIICFLIERSPIPFDRERY